MELQPKHALVIMAKKPQAGQTKTRLCPPLTAGQAAALYRCFLEDVIETVRLAAQSLPAVAPVVAFAPPDAADYFRRLAPAFALIPQRGERLNERLHSVFDAFFKQGYAKVAAINSDSPTLPEQFLVDAFMQLETADVVLGPCEDGGYYLIGLKRPLPEIILPVQMSTSHVLSDTLALIEKQGLSCALLPTWYDVDTVEELERLREEVNGQHSSTAAWFG